ncbi:unnamed protein product [Soboliphyme baturini]|uniref:RNA_pol_Rbc25 domain-containing protein n=1 Tax=Soboliphyme baturini TaxID=241478 RepID=A0A183IEB1_9BILA|nr:unnamed protein product [Soboliphyme baturini]
MFMVSKIITTICVPPHRFGEDFEDVIEDLFNEKFANKVILNVGLCIRLFDIYERSVAYVFPGDGAAVTRVSIIFFDNIFIPAEKLPNPSRFREREQLWIWDYPTDDGSVELFMEPGNEVRFRVMEEKFTDVGLNSTASDDNPVERESPYEITGSIGEAGLGCISWW